MVTRIERQTPPSEAGRCIGTPRGAVLLLLIASLASACGGETTQQVQTERRDSAGISLVESRGLPEEGARGWNLAPEPGFTVGTLEGDTLYQLFQVTSGALLEDGRIVIADNGNHQLRVFGPDGTFLTSMGRQGEGPGEFQSLEIMGTLGPDTVVVLDPRLRRINWFDMDSGFLFQAQVQEEAGMAYFANGMFQDGSVVFGGGLLAGPGSDIPDDGYRRNPTTYQSVDREGRLATEFGEFPGPEVIFRAQPAGGEMFISALFPHFGMRPQAIARGRTLALGSGDTFELSVFDPQGRRTRIVRVFTPPVPVTAEHLEALLEETLADLPDPSLEPRVRSSFGDLPHSETFPAYGGLLLDPEGYLWVEDYPLPGAERKTWTLFDPEGTPVTRLSLPSRHDILDIGFRNVLTLFEDEFGVEYLGLFSLTRGADGAS